MSTNLPWEEGEVPPRLSEAAIRLPLYEAAPGVILFRFPTVGRFLVRRGLPTRVEVFPSASPAAAEAFLAGPLSAAVSLLDGRFSLRASAVDVGGSAVLVIGSSSSVNSQMAAIMTTVGYPLLADGIVTFEPGRGWALGRGGRVVLHRRTAELMGLDSSAGEPVRPGLASQVYHLPASSGPLPVRHIFSLSPFLRGAETAITPLSGTRKVTVLTQSCWHGELVEPLGLAAAMFRWSTDLASAAPVSLVGWGADDPRALATRLAGHT